MIKFIPESKKCVLAISFLNYQTTVGGMSKYIMVHEKLYRERGYSYICLYSVKKIIKNRVPLFHYYGLIVDGKNLGVYTIDELLSFFSELSFSQYSVNDIHLHNISYMNIKHIKRLADTLYESPIKLILHDFHTVCTNFNLLKNGQTYCGDEGLNSEKCVDCKYYSISKKYIRKVRTFFAHIKDRFTIISPSEVAKEVWLKSYPDFRDQITIIQEQVWEGEYLLNRQMLQDNTKIKIGYLGNKSSHKGWDVWEKFAEQAIKYGDNYEFIVFNSKKDINENIMSHYPVTFQDGDFNAMITALRECAINCVLLWSVWPETYSYTLFEACAANAFIITNPRSGNIARVVEKLGNGIVLEQEKELYYYCCHPEELIKKINEVRSNCKPGPENLIDNIEFVDLTSKEITCKVNYKKKNVFYRLYQKIILSILMFILRHRKIII